MTKVIAFGEVLWDMLPSGTKLGGAPLNVVLHLRQQGIDAQIISKIGDDDLGKKLLHEIISKGLVADYVATDPTLSTSTVEVSLSTDGHASYTIVAPVAWDNIEVEADAMQAVDAADFLVFGSLAVRNDKSYKSLLQYIQKAQRCVFDVNFRAPHYSESRIRALLKLADIVKMNEEEVVIVGHWIQSNTSDLQACIQAIQQAFNIDILIVTRGAQGAVCSANGQYYTQAGIKVSVADTVGSGDAFLASFLAAYSTGKTIDSALKRASMVGAYVATQLGANPSYNLHQLQATYSL
ncbi:MAG: carbohydrate kinase [Bacteroidota bacterium]